MVSLSKPSVTSYLCYSCELYAKIRELWVYFWLHILLKGVNL